MHLRWIRRWMHSRYMPQHGLAPGSLSHQPKRMCLCHSCFRGPPSRRAAKQQISSKQVPPSFKAGFSMLWAQFSQGRCLRRAPRIWAGVLCPIRPASRHCQTCTIRMWYLVPGHTSMPASTRQGHQAHRQLTEFALTHFNTFHALQHNVTLAERII